MTEMAPEQPIPDEGEALEIEATGTLQGSVVTIESKLSSASIVLKFDVEDEDSPIDTLLAAAPMAAQRVLDALIERQQADK